MAEEKKDAPAAEPSKRKIFRNAGVREYHLRKRPDQAPSELYFILRPGQTITALDEAEETLLESQNELRDVAKEAPQMGSRLEGLEKELADAKAANAKLKEENASLQDKAAKLPKSK